MEYARDSTRSSANSEYSIAYRTFSNGLLLTNVIARRRPLENVRYAMEYSLFALLLVLALAYANGTNDVSKAIATLVGSGVTNYRTAVIWGTIWTTVGAPAPRAGAGAQPNRVSTRRLRP